MRDYRERKTIISINSLIALLGLGIVLFLLLLYSIFYLILEQNSIKQSLNEYGSEVLDRLADELQYNMWNMDYPTVILSLQIEARASDIYLLRLRNLQGELIVDVSKRHDGEIITQTDKEIIDQVMPGEVVATWEKDILFSGHRLGSIEIRVSNWQRQQELMQRIMMSGLTQLLFSLATCGFFYLGIRELLIKRISNLQKIVDDFGPSGFVVRAPVKRSDEIGHLATRFNAMAEMIQKYALEMEDQVKAATAQLVEAEKLAFLGRLVAGVAHEINTPVGSSLTVASYLETRIDEMKDLVARNGLTKVLFDLFLEDLATSTRLISSNLVRTSDLVRTFKGVGADQLSDDPRVFKLKEYLHEIIFSLSPKWSKGLHKIEASCPDDLLIETHPSAIYQIFSNLIMNSLIHAFVDERAGVMHIVVTRQADWLEIHYSDNGVGIPVESINQIFTPFYTTRRGQGGTGLGLYIVYTLIGKLGGTIHCESEITKGVTFLIRLPADIIRT